jgi:hypothetical protein
MAGNMIRTALVTTIVLAGTMFAPASARADEFVDRANAPYASIPAAQHAETTLFPLLAKLKPAPEAVGRLTLAALLPATSEKWPAVEAWCTSEESKAVLTAFKKLTDEKKWTSFPTIALPYGADKTDPDLVAAGMYVELGDPPSLTLAEFKYLPAIERLNLLLHAEATRLLAAGEGDAALDLMVRCTLFGRQMCERSFFVEQKLGYEMVLAGLQRLRDLCYTDLRSGSPKMTAEGIRDQIRRLGEGSDSLLGIARLKLPAAERLAGEQLLFRIMTPGAGPDEKQFPRMLTMAGDKNRPLRAFSDYAKWDAIRSVHANEAESRRQLGMVFGDWEKRWRMKPNDPGLKGYTDLDKTSRARFGSIDKLAGNVGELFELRQRFEIEAAGTRAAMACYGFTRKNNGNFPPSITSGVPDIIREIDLSRDPFTGERREHFRYVVPGRANNAATLEMQVFNGSDEAAFAVTFGDETFIIYSVGPDGNLNGARRATQLTPDDKGDYVIFPSMMSLFRKHMIDSGELK